MPSSKQGVYIVLLCLHVFSMHVMEYACCKQQSADLSELMLQLQQSSKADTCIRSQRLTIKVADHVVLSVGGAMMV